MKLKTMVFISIVFLVASAIIIGDNYQDTVIKARQPSTLTIDKDDLKECCQDSSKTCSVLKKYSCDLCNSKCS